MKLLIFTGIKSFKYKKPRKTSEAYNKHKSKTLLASESVTNNS